METRKAYLVNIVNIYEPSFRFFERDSPMEISARAGDRASGSFRICGLNRTHPPAAPERGGLADRQWLLSLPSTECDKFNPSIAL